MRTYDGFGTFSEDSPNVWTGKFNLSVPAGSTYYYTIKNISTPTGAAKHRNGITISFNLGGSDNGMSLMNSELNFETIMLNLNQIQGERFEDAHGVKAGDFDFDKPFYVFTFHDKNDNCFKNSDEACWNLLKNVNYCPVIPTAPGSAVQSALGPCKNGIGGMKRV